MRMRIVGPIVLTIVLLTGTRAYAAIDNAAAEVLLRTSCTDNAVTLNNCFTSLSTLNTWIWATRMPSATNPLHVLVGPGTHSPSSGGTGFVCNHSGHVTFTGAGINNSILAGSPPPIRSVQCQHLTFENLSVHGTGSSGTDGVINMGGSTVWNNVEIVAPGYAWSDGLGNSECTGDRTPGTHYWYGSRIVAKSSGSGSVGAVAYYNNCDHSWFYGSEITTAPHLNNTAYATALVGFGGEVHVYGGAIRAVPAPGVHVVGELLAVQSQWQNFTSGLPHDNQPLVHIHGTGIDVISPVADNVTALHSVHGNIHANASAYMMHTHGGIVTRIIEENPLAGDLELGTINAPYDWQNRPAPPNIVSKVGADTVVAPHPTTGMPRLLIYAGGSCTSRWYDPGASACYSGTATDLTDH
jgi:hypothetical protein